MTRCLLFLLFPLSLAAAQGQPLRLTVGIGALHVAATDREILVGQALFQGLGENIAGRSRLGLGVRRRARRIGVLGLLIGEALL